MRALLLSSALSVGLAFAPLAYAQNDAALDGFEQSMAAAEAQAQRPGDEALTCEQLESEIATTMQDPAVQSAVAANGAAAQAQLDQMNSARGQMRAQLGMSLFMGIAGSFVPGMGYAQAIQQRAMAAQQQRQADQNMAQMMQMTERMSGIMPQMMRGQRVYELGQARQCAFTQQQPVQ